MPNAQPRGCVCCLQLLPCLKQFTIGYTALAKHLSRAGKYQGTFNKLMLGKLEIHDESISRSRVLGMNRVTVYVSFSKALVQAPLEPLNYMIQTQLSALPRVIDSCIRRWNGGQSSAVLYKPCLLPRAERLCIT